MGTFSGKLLVEYNDGRSWLLREDPIAPFQWTGAMGIVAPPEGMRTDFATIPHLFSPILPGPGWGRKARWGPASVLHDWLYLSQARPDTSPLTRKEADDIFREAMKDLGVSRVYRFVIWAGVRCFGWIWWAWFRRRRAIEPMNAVMPSWRIFQALWWAFQDRH